MLAKIIELIGNGKSVIKIKSMAGVDFSSLVFSVQQKTGRPVIAMAADSKTARYIYKQTREISAESVFYLEAKEEIDFEVYSQDKDITRSRLKTLNAMVNLPNSVFVMSEVAFNQRIMGKENFLNPLVFELNKVISLEERLLQWFGCHIEKDVLLFLALVRLTI